MKSIIICSLLALVAVVSGDYLEKLRSINSEEVLQNRRLLLAFANCILEEGPCTSDAKDFKEYLVFGLKDECSKCSAEDRAKIKHVIGHLYHKENALWNKLLNKVDPDEKFRVTYAKEYQEIQNGNY